MSEWMKVFLALVAIIGGFACLLSYLAVVAIHPDLYAVRFIPLLIFGVLLSAAGGTYLWMMNRLFRQR
jgi:hypothetical protein